MLHAKSVRVQRKRSGASEEPPSTLVDGYRGDECGSRDDEDGSSLSSWSSPRSYSLCSSADFQTGPRIYAAEWEEIPSPRYLPVFSFNEDDGADQPRWLPVFSFNENDGANQPRPLETKGPRKLKIIFLDNKRKSCRCLFEEHDKLNNIRGNDDSFGTSCKATMNDGKLVVIKKLKANIKIKKEHFKKVLHDIYMSFFPNILSPIGFSTSGSELFIVYNYLPQGSLQDKIPEYESLREKGLLNMAPLIHVALGVACGLNYIHRTSRLNIHGHIKSSNILFAEPNEVLISDLGFASFSTSEILKKCDDIFDFGVLLLELLTGKNPSEFKKLLVNKRGKVKYSFVERMVLTSNAKSLKSANKYQFDGMLELCLSCLDNKCDLLDAVDVLEQLQRSTCNTQVDPRSILSRLKPGMFQFNITTYFNRKRGTSSVWLQGKNATSSFQNAILANGKEVIVRRQTLVSQRSWLLVDELDFKEAANAPTEEEFVKLLQIANINSHPNILTPVACGMDRDEFIFIYDYRSLSSIQSRLDGAAKHSQPGLFDCRFILHVILGVARVFSHIQDRSVDSPEPINLSNIFLDEMGNVLICDWSFIIDPLRDILHLETNSWIEKCLITEKGNKSNIADFGAIVLKMLSGCDILAKQLSSPLYNERKKNEFLAVARKCCQLPPDMSKCDMDELLHLCCSCLSLPCNFSFFEAVKIIENIVRRREVCQFQQSNVSSPIGLLVHEASSSTTDPELASKIRTTPPSKYNDGRGHEFGNSHKDVFTTDSDVTREPSPTLKQSNDSCKEGLSFAHGVNRGCDQINMGINISNRSETTSMGAHMAERNQADKSTIWGSSNSNPVCLNSVSSCREYFEIGIPSDYGTKSSGKFYHGPILKGIWTGFRDMLSLDPPFQEVLAQVRGFTAALVACGAPLQNWDGLVQDVLQLIKQRESLKMQLIEEDFSHDSQLLCTLQEEMDGLILVMKEDEQQLENYLESLGATESEYIHITDTISELEKQLERLHKKAKTLEDTILNIRKEVNFLEERKGKSTLDLSSREKEIALTAQRVALKKVAYQEKLQAISSLKRTILSKFASFPIPS